MTPANLLILVGSAFIHVVTHIALKRSRDRTAFVWWMLLFSGVLFVPVVLFSWQPVPWQGWALLIGSAVFEAGYFYAIAKAYLAPICRLCIRSRAERDPRCCWCGRSCCCESRLRGAGRWAC
jgi:hypothetical protein